jgi:TetR/AcrR family transcriptional regulator
MKPPIEPVRADATGVNGRRMHGEDRRRQIIQAAIEVFSKNGFQGTTTKQIATAAEVNEAIIFRHFVTKHDLYAAILDYKCRETGRERWIEELRELADRNDDEGLFHAIATRILDAYRKDASFQRLMLYAALEGHEFSKIFLSRGFPLHAFLREYVAKRQKAGALRKCDPGLLVLALMGLPSYFGMVTKLWGFNWGVSDAEAAKSFTQFLLDGVRKPSKGKPANFLNGVIAVRSQKPNVHAE